MNNANLLIEEHKRVAFELADKLKKEFPEIVGASLCGSIVWGNTDEFSDIDMDIWLPHDVYKAWILACPFMQFFSQYNIQRETPHNFSFGVRESHKFDLTILSLEKVKEDVWKTEQLANRYKSVILFDTENKVRDLLDAKMNFKEEHFENKEKYSADKPNPKEYYFFYISAYLNYHIPVALARKNFEQAHINLTWAGNLLLELLWVEFGKFYPYMKSRWFVAEKNLDEEKKELFRQANLIQAYDEEDVKRRRALLRKLYTSLNYEEVTFHHEKLDLS